VSNDSRRLVGSPPGTARMSVVQDSEVSGQHTCRPCSAGAAAPPLPSSPGGLTRLAIARI
jgi:hypothetical protein